MNNFWQTNESYVLILSIYSWGYLSVSEISCLFFIFIFCLRRELGWPLVYNKRKKKLRTYSHRHISERKKKNINNHWNCLEVSHFWLSFIILSSLSICIYKLFVLLFKLISKLLSFSSSTCLFFYLIICI